MKIPQRQEIWENKIDSTLAYVIGINRYGFVSFILKTGDVFHCLEFDQKSFMKIYKFKCNSQIDVADLFKEKSYE